MKKLFFALFFVVLISSIKSSGQTFYLNNGFISGGTVTTCSGKFYDSDPNDSYKPNENYTVTFCSGASDKIIQIVLNSISVAARDTLFAYDGNSIDAPVIDTFTNSIQNLLTFTPSPSNPTGCITFKFVSDGTNERNGWEGDIRCIFPCKQKITGSTFSTPVKDAIGYTNVCFGDSAGFSIKTEYPDNNTSYQQSDRTSVFHWFFGDGKDTSGTGLLSVKHLYTNPGGYHARLIITDSNGCSNKQPFRIPVKTSIRPVFSITPPSFICLLDTAAIKPSGTINGQSSVYTPGGSFVTLPVSGDSVFLPDEPPLCLPTSIVIEQFAPNQTLQNLDDIEGIFMNIEHSYLGDMTISIEAPNGAKVFLKTTVEGSANDGTFLGEPVDESLWGDPSDNNLAKIRGKGYQYSFSNTPQFGKMWDEVSKHSYTYTDNSGRTIRSHFYLPPGSYQSEESMMPLIGTPLNGKWILEICDKQAIDNGFLFNWKIAFKKSIYPNAETYVVPVVKQAWVASPGLVSTSNTTGFVSPSAVSTYPYTYHVDDVFGCSYDTTIKLVVNPIPAKPNLGADTTICRGGNLTLKVSNFEATNNYRWSTTQKGVSNISIPQPGSYWIEAINNKGCKNSDTVNVSHFDPFTVNLGSDTLLCANQPTILTPKASTNISNWKWNTGAATTTYTATTSGSYWVEAKDEGGCLVRDTIDITNNPISFFEMPGDTTICENAGYMLTLTPTTGTSILWDDNTTGYSHLIGKAATYSVTAKYKGCVHKTDMKVAVLPLPVFSLGRDTTMCNGYNVTLKASYPGASYRWNTGGTDSTYTTNRSGLYWAEATLNGCSYSDTLAVIQKLCACEIKMPNAFSPNGDGINDVYRPTIKCFPRDYHLSVFNRDGQVVFDSKNYQDLWDGKFKGAALPIATYYYILTLFNQDLMENEKKSGSITLLR
jgi:gliding motility-associated-like protein